MSNILGFSAGFHDAAITVLNNDGEILFAGHSERYSKIKNDPNIHSGLIDDIKQYDIDRVAYYERPWLHRLRTTLYHQPNKLPWRLKTVVKQQLGTEYANKQLHSFPHHLTHAAAAFQTSPFDSAAVVVIDAVGEFDTVSIYSADYDDEGNARYTKLWRQQYPHSIGLFYSAITKNIGLKPNEEEYIVMGMSAYAHRINKVLLHGQMRHHFIQDLFEIEFKDNHHIGIDLNHIAYKGSDNIETIAGAAQLLTEELIKNIIKRAAHITGKKNLVYTGGVALNCVANRNLGRYFENIWILPNPGDAGSSLGAAAAVFRKRIQFRNAFLGHNIAGPYPVNDLLDRLMSSSIVGVASGRAEFGPRALGNRSLLADPRGHDIKDRVNEIKRRQKFRPFAPVILEEYASEYFDMPRGWNTSRYMQSIAYCRRSDLFPAICHIDETSRVQTVPADDSGIRKLLEKWFVMTGCPMLLNTSLNVRGEPMVNDRSDADRFEKLYNVPVLS